MSKEASLPVRLDTDLDRRVGVAVGRLRITKSALIRMLLEAFVEEWERSGGRVVFPPVFESAGRRK